LGPSQKQKGTALTEDHAFTPTRLLISGFRSPIREHRVSVHQSPEVELNKTDPTTNADNYAQHGSKNFSE
jgi:hypothetical protein